MMMRIHPIICMENRCVHHMVGMELYNVSRPGARPVFVRLKYETQHEARPVNGKNGKGQARR